MLPHPSDAFLDALRLEGDPPADALVASLFESPRLPGDLARRGYNHLLALFDRLRQSPELYLLDDSLLYRELALYPEEMRDFFAPAPLPEWVDETLLARASRVWTENSVAVLLVLYSASLPYCYAIRNGIPMLYESAKLRDPRFITQRIHETGVFLQDLMDPGGLRVVRDVGGDPASNALLDALLERGEALGAGLRADLLQISERRQGGAEGARYLWGPGFLAARKVRVLHAAMRYMALNPARVRSVPEDRHLSRAADGLTRMEHVWPVERLGAPINQEDLAFTLQTFGHAIVEGLRHWGVRLSAEDRRAFLHLWRLAGHLLGIRPELLTDDEEEARALFQTTLRRQAGPSEQGQRLAAALLGMVRQYIPPLPGLRRWLPPVLVRDQTGDAVSRMVLPEVEARRSRSLAARAVWWGARLVLRTYYLLRHLVFERVTWLGDFVLGTFHRGAEALIHSWREDVARRDFDLPAADNSDWLQSGGGRGLAEHLRAWRAQVAWTLLAAATLMVLALPLAALALVVPAATWPERVEAAVLIGAGGVLASWLLVHTRMASLLRQRPQA